MPITLVMRPNKIETTGQWFGISCAMLAGYSGHDNSIQGMTRLEKKLRENYARI